MNFVDVIVLMKIKIKKIGCTSLFGHNGWNRTCYVPCLMAHHPLHHHAHIHTMSPSIHEEDPHQFLMEVRWTVDGKDLKTLKDHNL
jgi:hypothetical protein